MLRLASLNALWTAPGYAGKMNGRHRRGDARTCHVALVRVKRDKRMYPTIFLKTSLRVRNRNRFQVIERTYKACWLITTLESIFLSEVTTAAQVSSAEDSSASTVSLRE